MHPRVFLQFGVVLNAPPSLIRLNLGVFRLKSRGLLTRPVVRQISKRHSLIRVEFLQYCLHKRNDNYVAFCMGKRAIVQTILRLALLVLKGSLHDLGSTAPSASFLAEISVRSPRKLFIFTRKINFWIKVSKKLYNLILKEEADRAIPPLGSFVTQLAPLELSGCCKMIPMLFAIDLNSLQYYNIGSTPNNTRQGCFYSEPYLSKPTCFFEFGYEFFGESYGEKGCCFR